jgi:hypothetical protein
MIDRRGLLTGLAAGICAPAIVPYSNLMPVKLFASDPIRWFVTGTDIMGNYVRLPGQVERTGYYNMDVITVTNKVVDNILIIDSIAFEQDTKFYTHKFTHGPKHMHPSDRMVVALSEDGRKPITTPDQWVERWRQLAKLKKRAPEQWIERWQDIKNLRKG